MTFSLYQVAPRLAKARDERREELRVAAVRRRRVADLILKAERLVAHRDLQLVRAYDTRSSRYIAERQRKLKAAQSQLEHLRHAWRQAA